MIGQRRAAGRSFQTTDSMAQTSAWVRPLGKLYTRRVSVRTSGLSTPSASPRLSAHDHQRRELYFFALYRVLETEVVPLYFDRDSDGIPRRWTHLLKEAIRTDAPTFSARRMVKEYTERMYVPAMNASVQG